ncbi:hypothetical protein ACWD7C_36445 [Streptomyces sp. NPDC005134]
MPIRPENRDRYPEHCDPDARTRAEARHTALESAGQLAFEL